MAFAGHRREGRNRAALPRAKTRPSLLFLGGRKAGDFVLPAAEPQREHAFLETLSQRQSA